MNNLFFDYLTVLSILPPWFFTKKKLIFIVIYIFIFIIKTIS